MLLSSWPMMMAISKSHFEPTARPRRWQAPLLSFLSWVVLLWTQTKSTLIIRTWFGETFSVVSCFHSCSLHQDVRNCRKGHPEGYAMRYSTRVAFLWTGWDSFWLRLISTRQQKLKSNALKACLRIWNVVQVLLNWFGEITDSSSTKRN